MLGKRTRFITMVAAAGGIPYAWFNESISGPIRGTVDSLKGSFSATDFDDGSFLNVRWARSDGSATGSPGQPAAATTHQLAEVLRFDIAPRWITQQWPRVSTIPADSGLVGFRVPLITGTQSTDVTGSLTYYFDPNIKVQRLTLHGETGDERTLVAIASRFGLQPEPTLATGMLLSRWNGRPISVLRIMPAPVIRSDAPNSRYQFDLELNSPNSPQGLSREMTEILQHDSHVQRWSGP